MDLAASTGANFSAFLWSLGEAEMVRTFAEKREDETRSALYCR
jgi:hypothetical protein